MSYSIIAAVGKNMELGKKGGLCFNIPGDLKYFKNITRGHTVVMGANTFFSLPKMLKGRKHLVLCSDKKVKFPDDVIVYNSMDELFKDYPLKSDEEIFVIGGGRVYASFLKYAKKLYLTEVDATDKEADTFFEEFDKRKYSKTENGEGSDGDIHYKFVIYEKRGEI